MSYYEVVYYYNERLPNGKWNTDERLEMKKKIGGPNEEVELEKLASIILSQLSKRDKLVIDVDVYEYVKRKITYKESTDGSGIILKNKKFTTGITAGQITCEDVECDDSQPRQSQEIQVIQRNDTSNFSHVKTWMFFDPEIPLLHEAKRNGLQLTMGKKYPIYNIAPHPSGLGDVLTLIDDKGKRIVVSDKYFTSNIHPRLYGDNEVEGGFNSTHKQSDLRLSYNNQFEHDNDMPNLRPNLSFGG